MSLPREPRQKMINMMYLVLTALLALNVSSEILNAFKTVNSSLEKSNSIVTNSTSDIMKSFERKLNDPQSSEQAKIWYPKATQTLNLSKGVLSYIVGLKSEILDKAGADYAKGDSSFKEDNLDIATHLMVEKGKGKELKKMLEDYRKAVLAVDPAIAKEFNTTLPIDLSMPKTQNKGNNSWEAAYFRMVPTVAAITMLSKFENDVRTAENKVITWLHNKVGSVELIPDTYAAVVGQSSSYLIPGQKLEITAGVGAFNKKVAPIVTVAGRPAPVGDDGVARIEMDGGGVGSHSVPVRIEFKDIFGKPQVIEKKIEYMVGQTSAAVALDKMNVLFIGVDNPVSISASGDINKVSASITNGSLIRGSGPGQYFAKVNTEGDVTINVTSEGKTTPFRFRVRSIPDPTPRVGANKSGDISAALFKSQGGVNALVENFFYETQFTVTGFRITFDGAGFEEGIDEKVNTGAAWNESRSSVNKVRPGTFITIEDIRAVGPDGRTRRLTPLIFSLK
jgi:gliding motility-associated protein GldM